MELPLENLLQIVGVAGYILLSVAPSAGSLLYSSNEKSIRCPSIEQLDTSIPFEVSPVLHRPPRRMLDIGN